MKLIKQIKKEIKGKTPFHMPGHKRNKGGILPYKIDVTEIPNTDTLYSPTGILKESEEKWEKLLKSYKTFYLVNGSTSGILSAIKTLCPRFSKIIMPKDVHKSVYNAVELLCLKVVYLESSVSSSGVLNSIDVENFRKTISLNSDAKCVIFSSPTYFGVISDVKSICEIAHEKHIPVVVDEAHGAHLFLENKNALNFGADIVVNSLHKTLPCLTQTAIVSIGKNTILDKEQLASDLQENVSIFCSSSPSYPLLCSMDECAEFLQKKGEKRYKKFKNNLNYFNKKIQNLQHIKVLSGKEFFDFDSSKIVISTIKANISGNKLMNKLFKRGIVCEMGQENLVLAYATICDKKNAFKKLANALKKIDKTLQSANKAVEEFSSKTSVIMPIYRAKTYPTKPVDFRFSVGEICGEYVYCFPPDIPLLCPGEKITKEIAKRIVMLKSSGANVVSSNGKIAQNIVYVLDNYKKECIINGIKKTREKEKENENEKN